MKELNELDNMYIGQSFNSVVGTVSFNNYPKLKDLKLGGFRGTEALEIRDLNSLESLTIIGCSFDSTRSLMMDSNNESHKLILRSPFSSIN